MANIDKVIDGTKAKHARSGLVYTCKCGWIDLGHARPDGLLKMWRDISGEGGEKSRDGKGFKLTYRQTQGPWGISGFGRDYYVKRGLTTCEKQSVALAVLMEVSLGFEQFQSRWIFRWRGSGFSAEDLVSNVLGFYRAVRPEQDYLTLAEPVSLGAAQDVLKRYGDVKNNKNHSFGAFLYPCAECTNSPNGPACSPLPPMLSVIKPAIKGKHFRDWNPRSDAKPLF